MEIIKKPKSVNELALNFILYATIGTLCAGFLDLWLKLHHIGKINKEFIFLPWAISLVLGVFAGYKFGVNSEREHSKNSDKEVRS